MYGNDAAETEHCNGANKAIDAQMMRHDDVQHENKRQKSDGIDDDMVVTEMEMEMEMGMEIESAMMGLIKSSDVGVMSGVVRCRLRNGMASPANFETMAHP